MLFELCSGLVWHSHTEAPHNFAYRRRVAFVYIIINHCSISQPTVSELLLPVLTRDFDLKCCEFADVSSQACQALPTGTTDANQEDVPSRLSYHPNNTSDWKNLERSLPFAPKVEKHKGNRLSKKAK